MRAIMILSLDGLLIAGCAGLSTAPAGPLPAAAEPTPAATASGGAVAASDAKAPAQDEAKPVDPRQKGEVIGIRPPVSIKAEPSNAPSAAKGDAGIQNDQAACTAALLPFQYPPVDLAAIEFITPMGLMSDSHVTPVDHVYYQNFKEPERTIAVYSPAAGTITQLQRMTQTLSDNSSQSIDDYRLVIDHGCGISSVFIHIGQLTPEIAAVAPPPGEFAMVSHPVEAGEQLGEYQSNVDYNVVDQSVTLEGLLVPEHYEREPCWWALTSAAPDPACSLPWASA